jgi:glycosyltransferase involved in cell wall biosynthesis
LAGSYPDFEVLVSDDAGPRTNREIVESFADSRIRYRRNSIRLGSAANHTAAIAEIRGRYVALLNDDDAWEPQFLEKLVPALDLNPTVSLAFGDHYVMDADGRIDANRTNQSTVRWRRDILKPGLQANFQEIALVHQSVPMVSALVRRDAVDWSDCPPEVQGAYDLWVSYLACRNPNAAWYTNERIARYRVHGNNLSGSPDPSMTLGTLVAYSRMVGDPNLAQIHRELRRKLAISEYSHGIVLLRSGEPVAAKRFLFRAALLTRSIKPVIGFVIATLPRSLRERVIRRSNETSRSS